MTLRITLVLAAVCAVLASSSAMAPSHPDEKKATVSVECTRASGLVQVNILHHRKIGNVHLVVKDAKGKTVYVEEGKAMTEELVRRFDKGMLPKGAATITVEARDFTITQGFMVQ
ncbi:MAG: hypothetical protein JNM62_04780 [Flavobacteriales bacterium]|nr:hypothetical protein [Flavobacteriales bacterium]